MKMSASTFEASQVNPVKNQNARLGLGALLGQPGGKNLNVRLDLGGLLGQPLESSNVRLDLEGPPASTSEGSQVNPVEKI